MKENRIWKKWACLAGLCVLFSLCGCGAKQDSLEMLLAQNQMGTHTGQPGEVLIAKEQAAQNASDLQGQSKVQTSDNMQTLWVHICGYVKTPGIYEMPLDARLYDALMAAGGFAKGANENALNLAEFLKDGSRIYVPGLEMAIANEADGMSANAGLTEQEIEEAALKDALININTASQNLLETLPGIGPVKAKDIIAHRKENGPFSTIEEIKEVPGIKDAIFERLKAFITVEGS